MSDQFDITLKPFSLRHRRLLNARCLEDLPGQVRQRLWNTLNELSEPYEIYTNSGWVHHSSDLEQTHALYARLMGVPEGSFADDLGNQVLRGPTHDCLDVLECFCAWMNHEGDRLPKVQRAINETLRDFNLPWRMAEGTVFQVENDYLEDEILSEVPSLLGLAEFQGALQEFIKARDHLTDGNPREAIFYAHASVESTYKAALGGSSKIGADLVQAYANAGYLTGLSKERGQAIQKSLMPTATLRNELGGHGQGEKVMEVPREYGEFAIGLAAVTNAFITRQHLKRIEEAAPRKSPSRLPEPAKPEWDDEDIPF